MNLRKFLYKKRQNLYFKLFAKELFFLIDDAMTDNGLFYWFEFGTLLGAVRDHSFIKHDRDMDFGMMYSERDKAPKALASKGIKLFAELFVPEKNALLQKYRYKGIFFDIYFFNESDEGDKMSCYSFYNIGSYRKRDKVLIKGVKRFVFPHTGFSNIEFLGRKVNIPENVDERLRLLYGDNYMIPDPSFSENKNPNINLCLKVYDIEEMIGAFVRKF